MNAKVESAKADLARLRGGWEPGEEELADAPLLEGWYFAQHPYCAALCLCGDLTGHPRLPDGPSTTSPLIAIGRQRDWARTIGRWYRLGTPDPDDVE